MTHILQKAFFKHALIFLFYPIIKALESGHIAGAGLDVIDGDRNIYYRDHKNQMIIHHEMAILNSMPNVLMLPHAAYFTDQALEDMVHNSLIVTSQCFKAMKEQPGFPGCYCIYFFTTFHSF